MREHFSLFCFHFVLQENEVVNKNDESNKNTGVRRSTRKRMATDEAGEDRPAKVSKKVVRLHPGINMVPTNSENIRKTQDFHPSCRTDPKENSGKYNL